MYSCERSHCFSCHYLASMFAWMSISVPLLATGSAISQAVVFPPQWMTLCLPYGTPSGSQTASHAELGCGTGDQGDHVPGLNPGAFNFSNMGLVGC